MAQYEWGNKALPILQEHSRAKHDVLRQYLIQYVLVLTTNPKIDAFKLVLVDGFAGGGLFRTETGQTEPGSPLIMLEAMKEAAFLANQHRAKPFRLDVDFHFVEKDPATAAHLRLVLEERGYLQGEHAGRVNLHVGSFTELAPQIVRVIRSRRGSRTHRVIMSLDQYGYTDVRFSLLRRLFAELPSAEVLLTFATGWILAYLNESMRPTLEALIEDRDVVDRMLAASDDAEGRRFVQVCLHKFMAEQSGAAFYTPFFITSPEANRSYWLVHLSQHQRARDVMMSLHWGVQNRFTHYGTAGFDMLGFDPREAPPGVQGGFTFSPDDRALTTTNLAAQLPGILRGLDDGVAIETLYGCSANRAPASLDILLDAVRLLQRDGGYVVHGPQGGKIRNAEAIGPKHVLVRDLHLGLWARR